MLDHQRVGIPQGMNQAQTLKPWQNMQNWPWLKMTLRFEIPGLGGNARLGEVNNWDGMRLHWSVRSSRIFLDHCVRYTCVKASWYTCSLSFSMYHFSYTAWGYRWHYFWIHVWEVQWFWVLNFLGFYKPRSWMCNCGDKIYRPKAPSHLGNVQWFRFYFLASIRFYPQFLCDMQVRNIH